MARQLVETLIDDLDGSEAVETVSFAVDGMSYEIDLSKRNAAAMRRTLSRYVDAARTTGGGARSSGRAAAKKGKGTRRRAGYDLADLREWAAANKVKVASRGRIPQAVVDQYLARNS